MRIGLVTIQYGRRANLARQASHVRAADGVAAYVVVSMDPQPASVSGARVLHLPAGGLAGLPLASARNLGIAALADDDVDLIVILDADCVPDAGLFAGYGAGHLALEGRPGLLAGPVGYLSHLDDDSERLSDEDVVSARRNVKRTFPAAGIVREPRTELFWSLSYAVTPEIHARIGGFDESYAGYGAEDTDYGFRARARGVELYLCADAWAYHQPHEPVLDSGEMLVPIVANLNRFHDRWGRWPMPDWIERSLSSGRVAWARDGRLIAEPPPRRAVDASLVDDDLARPDERRA